MVIMTEPSCEPDEPKRPSKKDFKAVSLVSEADNGGDEKKAAKPYTDPSVLISETELIEPRQRPPLIRSKTYDSTLGLEMKNDMKLERKKSSSNQFMKSNAHFHKLFKDVSKDELLRESFTCALQKEILYQGKLYISENWICFHSKVFGKDTKIAIPTIAVTVLKKTKTALLVPNALLIATVTERFIFVSLLSRDSTYKLLKAVCCHLENASVGNSPNPSADHSDRGDNGTSYPLDFSVDYTEIDGLVRQRKKDIEEYSSTGSQTPESEHSQVLEFPKQEKTVLTNSHSPIVVENLFNNESKLIQKRIDDKRLFQRLNISKITSLNGLLFFYAILVCLLIFSTLYMQSRIVHLEERLFMLGAAKDVWSVDQGVSSWHINANHICEELTANLAKLDKIQKNLQKLLEDAN
ncbi:GRAM domain-containing protein 2B isoform X2 [Hyperolius riggenbachi]|uniref:GRAM domain-containing protein 2B isoform X2 n=1 Tax=Hyperolius riggenbachi TaxID=752182 RepID=UPI0035A364D4